MRGHVTRGRVEGTWYLRVELTRTAQGKRRQSRETFRGTKREAEARLRTLIYEAENGGLDAPRITVQELCARYLDAAALRTGAKHAHIEAQRIRDYIVPALGSFRARDLRPAHIEAALAAWRAGPRKDRQRGHLSASTLKHLFNQLRTICRWGVRMGILTRNVIASIEPPKVVAKEMQALDADGVARLLSAAQSNDLQAPIALAIASGLRRGELLALHWSDIDLEAGRLSVRRSLETIDGATQTKEPKTERSRRTVALPAFALEILRAHRNAQNERRLRLGLGRSEDGWVFDRGDGEAIEPGFFSQKFARFAKRAGVRVRFHDLRHSYATLSLASGVDLKTVSSALGHSAISTTGNIYLHAVESLQQDAAARLDLLLGGVVAEAVAVGSVPQPCHARPQTKKKPRVYGADVVALTGIEPVFAT